MRRSEKAKVPEEAYPEVQMLRDPRMSEYILTHKHHTHPHAASGWRIHCGVEVTELSTNKQHSLKSGSLRGPSDTIPTGKTTSGMR